MTTDTGQAAVAPTESKYHVLSINISAARRDTNKKLEALAEKLGCGKTGLVWYAIEQVLANPPKEAPAGSTSRVGTAFGFWVTHDLGTDGRAKAISIVECVRGQVQGRIFFRYTEGDDKGRKRAYNQAQQAADYDAKITGIKRPADGFPVKSLLKKQA